MKLLSVLCCRDVSVRSKLRPDMFVVMSGLFFFLFTLYTRCLFCVLVQRKVRPDMFPFRLLW